MTFFGLGGKNADQQNKSIGNLGNIFNYAMPTGSNLSTAGSSNLGAAGDYFKNLVSGNRSAMTTAVAPERKAIQTAADASRKQAGEMGTARGGGVAANNQNAADDTRAKVDQAIFGLRPAAASGAAQVGGTQVAGGTNLLNVGGSSQAASGDIATKARSQAAAGQGALIQAAIGAIFG